MIMNKIKMKLMRKHDRWPDLSFMSLLLRATRRTRFKDQITWIG